MIRCDWPGGEATRSCATLRTCVHRSFLIFLLAHCAHPPGRVCSRVNRPASLRCLNRAGRRWGAHGGLWRRGRRRRTSRARVFSAAQTLVSDSPILFGTSGTSPLSMCCWSSPSCSFSLGCRAAAAPRHDQRVEPAVPRAAGNECACSYWHRMPPSGKTKEEWL